MSNKVDEGYDFYKTMLNNVKVIKKDGRTLTQPVQNRKKHRIQIEQRTDESKGLYIEASQCILKKNGCSSSSKEQKKQRKQNSYSQAGTTAFPNQFAHT